jgi:nitrate reductase (cytochrome), electron transfer subunit
MRALLGLVGLCATLSWAAAPPPYEFYDRMRGDVALDVEPRPAPIAPVENRDLRRQRGWAAQPPTIPHKIDNYQLDKYANKCMTCHARTKSAESQAPAVSTTHYQDREGRTLAAIPAYRDGDPSVRSRLPAGSSLDSSQSALAVRRAVATRSPRYA